MGEQVETKKIREMAEKNVEQERKKVQEVVKMEEQQKMQEVVAQRKYRLRIQNVADFNKRQAKDEENKRMKRREDDRIGECSHF
jgi:hypothetical protein